MTNPFEREARLRKVVALADALRNARCSAAHLELLETRSTCQGFWLAVSRTVGVNPPSETTRREVIERLRELEGIKV